MRIELPSGTSAELALPAGEPRLGVALAPDMIGLRPLFDELCARLASERDWAVCAREPFPGQEHLTVEERMARMSTLDDDRLVGDLVAAADATRCDTVGVIGFCMGGMYALKAAGTGRFARAVSFYGMIRVPDAWRGPGQREPLEYLAVPRACPVLALLGGQDAWTPAADREALKATGAQIVVYPDADHGFAHPDRPAYRPDDAADAWARAYAFLEEPVADDDG